MHIGLFGGTFNPIHTGHLIIADALINQTSINKIIFIPAAIPPHKQNQTISAAKHRFKMIQLAIQDFPEFEVSDFEIKRGEVSYTIQTVQCFLDRYTSDTLYFIIGADSLAEMKLWREPERLIHMIRFIVVNRPGFDMNEIKPEFHENVLWVNTPLIEISSTQIRQQVRNHQSIRFLVPSTVENYIHKNALYQTV